MVAIWKDRYLEQLTSSISTDSSLRAATEAEIDWADDTDLRSGHASIEKNNPNVVGPAPGPAPRDNAPPSERIGPPAGKAAQLFSAQMAANTSNALIQYATGSTLLPQQIAEVVSNLSVLARISLKSAAFFIELILEAAKYSTGMGLGITRRALIGAVGTARAFHSLGGGEEWDAQAAGRPLTIANSVKSANEAFLSLLDKYTAVGIYLIHHTFTMAELFAMSSFYIAGGSLKAGLAAADESVRMIDGIFGSNETSRALASFITLIRGEFAGDPRFADTGKFGILATLTKTITAFAVLQNSTYKRSAKSMKMKVIYDCTVLGEVEAKSWRSMIVGSGNFIKTQRPVEARLLQSPTSGWTADALPDRSTSSRCLPLPGSSRTPDADGAVHTLQPTVDEPVHGYSLPSSRTRSHLGNGLCLTDIGPSHGGQGWATHGLPSPRSPFPTRPGSVCEDDASIMADLDFLVGTDDCDLGAVEPLAAPVATSELPPDLQRSLGRYGDEELQAGVVVDDPASGGGGKRVRRYVRKRAGPGRNETVYEITTETIETVETVTTSEERVEVGKQKRLPAPLDLKRGSRFDRSGAKDTGSSLVERDVTSSRSGFGTQSTFDGGRETTYEEEDEWCEIARTTNTTANRSGSADTIRASLLRKRRDDEAHIDSIDDDDDDEHGTALPEAPNGRAVALRSSGRRRNDRDEEAPNKMQTVLKTMTKKLVQKRRTIRKIELRSDTDEDEDEGTRQRRGGPYAGHGHLSQGEDDHHVTHRRREPPKASQTAPSSPTIGKHGFGRSHLTRHTSPPAPLETSKASSKNAEMSVGLQKVFKLAKNSLKNAGNPSSSIRPAIASNTLSGRRQVSPQSDLCDTDSVTEMEEDKEGTPKRSSKSARNGGKRPAEAQRRNLPGVIRALDSLPTPPSRSKRTASPAEAAEAKVAKQAGSTSPKPTPKGLGKELPQIPTRTESKPAALTGHDAAAVDRLMPFPGATSTKGSVRERHRSRAPSITSLHSFASKTHQQSTARGPAQGSSEVDSARAFPRAHLVFNLSKFMRHSSAAYGQNFMRILGIGSLDYFFPDTTKHHANVWAFAHHVGIPVDSILLNSFSEPQSVSSERMSPLVNYVAVDDQAQAVVLTCRGTLGLSDILTDLTCTYEDIRVPGAKPDEVYQVHSGMLASAKRLSSERGTVMCTIRNALEANPEYGLVITGHSLGGGVAALLAILLSCKAELFQDHVLKQQQHSSWSRSRHPKIFTQFVTALDCGLPAGRPIHAYAYGVPAVSSPDLSRYCRGLVTSVVHGHDFVPTLSLGILRDMKNIAQTLSEDAETDTAQQIVSKVIGLYQKRRGAASMMATGSMPASFLDGAVSRPSEPPASERELVMEPDELKQGRSRNRANDSGYQDPGLAEDDADPFSYSQGGGLNPSASSYAAAGGDGGVGGGSRTAKQPDGVEDSDADLQDWLWSLIKTIRADMREEKLYPPGDVYCIESFPVFVTPRTQPNGSVPGSNATPPSTTPDDGRAEAHRVILRYCEDVEKRFSEPIFAKSMLRDHVPTNYELCMSLLFESVVPRAAEP